MKSRFNERLIKKVAEEVMSNSDHVLSGGCADWGEYRFSAGFISGLKRALQLMDEVDEELMGGNERGVNNSDQGT